MQQRWYQSYYEGRREGGLLLGDRFKVWDVRTASRCFAKTRFPQLRFLKFNPSGDQIIASGPMGTKIWNLNGDVRFNFPELAPV